LPKLNRFSVAFARCLGARAWTKLILLTLTHLQNGAISDNVVCVCSMRMRLHVRVRAHVRACMFARMWLCVRAHLLAVVGLV